VARLSTVPEHAETDEPSILNAAQVWKQKCMLSDGSVFSDSKLWTASNLAILDEQFIENPIKGDEPFLVKFRRQLEPTPGPVKQLAAEILWLMLLFPTNIGGPKKRQNVMEVWSWSGEILDESHPLLMLLDHGIGSAGQAYNQRCDLEIAFAIRLSETGST